MSKKLKKDLQHKVAETLSTTFEGFKGDISPKKFKRNIKKASKVLLAGLKLTPPKKATAKKKETVKKEAVKEVAAA